MIKRQSIRRWEPMRDVFQGKKRIAQQKFFGGPGGNFSKTPPGRRRQKETGTLLLAFLFFVLSFVLHAGAAQDIDYAALDKYIGKTVKDFEVVGLSIAIVKDGAVVFDKNYGCKDYEKKDKVGGNSLFNIASCSKAFTAACIGILVQEGKLAWKDKVIDYLPEFRLSDPYITRELTIKDLLCHRSGLETFGGDLLWYETGYDSKEIIRRMRYIPVKRQFRSEYGYQNNMYIVAGAVIEKVSGKSWGEFLSEKILQPLEMKTTRFSGKQVDEKMDVAYPHIGQKKYPRWIQPENPAASLFSSSSEMANWIRMLLDGGKWKDRQILESGTIAELFSSQTIRRVSSFAKKNGTRFRAYGLGWGLYDYYGEKIVEHSGGMPGYISKVMLVPDRNLGVVILTNNMKYLTTVLRYKILDLFLQRDGKKDWAAEFLEIEKKYEKRRQARQEKRAAERVKRTRPALKLKEYVGVFEDRMYGKAEVVFKEKKLFLTLLPTKEVFTSRMEHWHYNTFRVKFKDDFLPDGYVTFGFDSHGKVTGFKIDLPNPDFHFRNLDFKKAK
ncbi:MAG: serine hydrolase [Candidatus Aminicenantes bacterium]|nr:serine hydrolase [Candidatus Aminicenantes bacterium]